MMMMMVKELEQTVRRIDLVGIFGIIRLELACLSGENKRIIILRLL